MSAVYKTIKIGEWEVTAFDDGLGDLPASLLVEGTYNPEKHKVYFPVEGVKVKSSTQVFVLKGKGKIILIDSGYGNTVLNNLTALKIKTEDVDIILITHAHPDHLNGLIKNKTPFFPKAQVLFSAPEKAAYIGNGSFGGVPDQVAAAYGPRIGTFKYGEEIVPGLKSVDLSGHTIGQSGFELVGNDGSKILFAGDFVHATDLQFAYPDLCFTYDADVQKSASTRRWVMEIAAKGKFLIAGCHILYPGIGHSEKLTTGGEYKFIPIPL